MTLPQFEAPYVHEEPFGDDPDDLEYFETVKDCWEFDQTKKVTRSFVFDTPDWARDIDGNMCGRDDTQPPGRIQWQTSWEIEGILTDWLASWASLPRTKTGKLKRDDQEFIDKRLSKLQTRITEDVVALLVHDPRYAEIIVTRVNQTLRELKGIFVR
jgi:hypothetical protein